MDTHDPTLRFMRSIAVGLVAASLAALILHAVQGGAL